VRLLGGVLCWRYAEALVKHKVLSPKEAAVWVGFQVPLDAACKHTDDTGASPA
jgi:hypothetical protein